MSGDLTSCLAAPEQAHGRAWIRAKQAGVLAGVECARLAFTLLDEACDVHGERSDGDAVAPGDALLVAPTKCTIVCNILKGLPKSPVILGSLIGALAVRVRIRHTFASLCGLGQE